MSNPLLRKIQVMFYIFMKFSDFYRTFNSAFEIVAKRHRLEELEASMMAKLQP
jgi:hypothetical protein